MRKKASEARRRALGLHERLKRRREELGLSLEDVATCLRVDYTTYLRIEAGSISVTAERVAELASILKVSAAYLYGEDEARAS